MARVALTESFTQRDASLLVWCLGGFTLEIPGEPITSSFSDYSNAGNRIVTAILAYLVTHMQRPVSRAKLIDLFWPDCEGDKAGNSLSRSLSGLRKLLTTRFNHKLDLAVIRNGDDAYWLRPRVPCWTDEDAFVQHVEAGGRLKEAAELRNALREFASARDLYGGSYLSGVAYDSWCLLRRTKLRELYHLALFGMSDILRQTNRHAEAIGHLYRVLESDPANESAFLKLMELHWMNGNRSEALGIYDVCCRILQERFGLQPRPPLEAIRSRILAGEEPVLKPRDPLDTSAIAF